MNVLITGGAGFLGAHLARRLHGMGAAVRVLDDFSSGNPAHLPEDIFVTRGDVRDVPKLWSLLHGVDLVYHLAARVSVPASILYPREYNEVNVGGTVALLEACRDVGVGRVVLASSATVYGEQSHQPIREAAQPHPRVPYAISKLAAEHYLFSMGGLSGFQTVALRIFNAYGPGQPIPPVHAPVIPNAMKQILHGGTVVIFGNGSQTRDFIYVDDVIDALVSAGQTARVDQRIINIGSGTEISINQVVHEIGRIVGRSANVLYNTESSGGSARLVADIELAGSLLKFQPKVHLQEGLRRLLRADPNLRTSSLPSSSMFSI